MLPRILYSPPIPKKMLLSFLCERRWRRYGLAYHHQLPAPMTHGVTADPRLLREDERKNLAEPRDGVASARPHLVPIPVQWRRNHRIKLAFHSTPASKLGPCVTFSGVNENTHALNLFGQNRGRAIKSTQTFPSNVFEPEFLWEI